MKIGYVALCTIVLLGGCSLREGRTAHDDFRSTCEAAARAYMTSAGQANAGTISKEEFAGIRDAYNEIFEACKARLSSQ